MRLFSQQYRRCVDEGMTGKGPVLPWTEKTLPWNPRIAKSFLEKMPEGLETVGCKRFGGVCSSAQAECKAMREKIPDEPYPIHINAE